MRINHNISALRALHQLDKSNSKLDKTLERLSSGLRINHAADDAAGLAITQKMDTQVRGLEQANRNAMDGISLIQTAEGALNEVHSMLQRIRELAVQVSNGTYDSTDRKAVQDEVTQLQNEIERISEDIEFNEMKLLNGDIDRRAFSTNEDVADIVSMSDTVDAGEYTFSVTQIASKTSDTGGVISLMDGNGEASVSGTININGEQVDIEVGDSSEEVFAKIRDVASRVNVDMSIEPSAPFANGKQLTLELDEYGPEELNVTGDLQVLQGLGLDSDNFNPNSDTVYSNTPATLDFSSVTSTPAEVYINGVTVSLDSSDLTSGLTLVDALKDAEIPGVEFSVDSASALQVNVFSTKPVSVEAVDSTDTSGDAALATALANLETSTSVADDTIKSVSTEAVDTSVTAATGQISVLVGSTVVTVPSMTANLSTASGREEVIQNLNDAMASSSPETTFMFDEDTQRISAYNTNGDEVTIIPASATTANLTLSEALGYESSDVDTVTKFGNIGKDVEIDSSSITYDDSTTSEIDGFPEGTTVTTSGVDIIFESNDNFELRLSAGGSTGEVTMNLLETGPLDLQIGANEGQSMEIRIQNLSPQALSITDINLSTAEGAQEAITTIDEAITTISNVRSKLGAYQNRLEHTIANLDTASENMTASLSRILDADMAYEMAQFTQQNIIQQAGTSMLAQANQRPQSLLQLLQG